MSIQNPEKSGGARHGAPHSPSRSAWRGGMRLAVWCIALVASGASVLVAASQSRGGLGSALPATQTTAPDLRAAIDLPQLSGFQKRGNALIGEVRTRDGTMLRLVFDARTQALIGLKVLATTPEGPACPVEAISAPVDAPVEPLLR
jgi:hypothetical protein